MAVISIEHVTKTYRIGVGRARIREMLPAPIDSAAASLAPNWWTRDTFNALEDVSFSIDEGSSVALVGHNGAGKTTLLKALAGITSPTRGSTLTQGRVAALIDMLVGFNPDLTGKENIYLLAAMHGFGRSDMRRKVDEIFDFAEITDLADTPVKRYSAGMGARLGFSTIVSLEPDILLIDEVLAVGDAGFQRKCVDWLDGYRQSGGTLVFVSHNLSLVRHMTDRAIWLNHGCVQGDGPTHQILGEYARSMSVRTDRGEAGNRGREVRRQARSGGLTRWGAGGVRVEKVDIDELPQTGLQVTVAWTGDASDEAILSIGFQDEEGREIGGCVASMGALGHGAEAAVCRIPELPLRPGIYFPVISILASDGLVRDRWRMERAVVVEVNGKPVVGRDLGSLEVPAAWTRA
jgi:ABC-type polysaccharide/polyol phosphate transport system ATPase subunit